MVDSLHDILGNDFEKMRAKDKQSIGHEVQKLIDEKQYY